MANDFQIIYHQPSKEDFFIPGELLQIKIHFNSFSVFFQLPGKDRYEMQLSVFERIFPIETLTEFFRVNGEQRPGHGTIRPHFAPSFKKEFISFFQELGFEIDSGTLSVTAKLLVGENSWIEAYLRTNNRVSVNSMDDGDRCPIIAEQEIKSLQSLRDHLKASDNLRFHGALYKKIEYCTTIH